MLSSFAFKINLRRYIKAAGNVNAAQFPCAMSALDDVVGRCRLTVSNPVLKAPMVSALETTI
jgi:hypothetical protein